MDMKPPSHPPPSLTRRGVLCASASQRLLPLNAKDPRCSKDAIELRAVLEGLVRAPFVEPQKEVGNIRSSTD